MHRYPRFALFLCAQFDFFRQPALGFWLFANNRCRDIAPASCACTARAAAFAATHAGTRKFEVLVAWQIGIVVRAMARVPLFAKATEEGDLDGDANPYDNDGKYDPTRNIHTQMLAYPNK